MLAEENQRARMFLREFDPRKYPGYYRRIYDCKAYLDGIGIEVISELIEHGNGVFNVAEALDISTSSLRKWLNATKDRRDQVLLANTFAGDAYAQKAEKVLMAAQHGSKEQVALAGKLAEHYRWMASRLSRETFGDSKPQEDISRPPPMVLNLNLTGNANGMTGEVKTVTADKHALKDIFKLTPLVLPDEVQQIDPRKLRKEQQE